MGYNPRSSKIARLPARIRQQLNERLRDGETGPLILSWVNGLPEARAVLDRHLGGVDISLQNLSTWRLGEYLTWLRQQERVEQVSQLSELSFRLAKASGGNLAEGVVAIAGGQLLEVLENVAALQTAPGAAERGARDLSDLVKSVVALRRSEIDTERVKIERARLGQTREQLSLERARFERQTAELFLKWYADQRAKDVAEGHGSKQVKIDELRQLMFGQRPPAGKTPAQTAGEAPLEAGKTA